MKWLILSLLILTACGRKFKVGDCIAVDEGPFEKWETPSGYIKQIIEIGEHKYKVVFVKPNNMRKWVFSVDFLYENVYSKVTCPAEITDGEGM